MTDHDATPQHDSDPEEAPDTSASSSRAARTATADEADPAPTNDDGGGRSASTDGGDADGGDGDGGDGGSGARRRRRRGRRGRGRRGGGQGRTAAQDAATTDSSDTTASDSDASAAATSDDASGAGEARSGGTKGARAAEVADAAAPAEAGGQAADADTGDEGDDASAGGGRQARGERGGSQRSSSRSGSRSRSGGGASRRGRSRNGSGGGDGGSGGDGGEGGDSGGDGGPAAEQDRAVEDAIAKGGTRMAAKRGGRRSSGGGNGGRRANQRSGGVAEEVRRAILEGPPRTMLVTSREDRTQIAVLEDRTVVEHYVTRAEDVTFVGNIYMARVQNVLPGMEAAFLDIGKGRNGVLYAGEVLYDELDLEEGDAQRIENALKPGQKVLVQVTKDPMGSKGPRLTMHLSLAGRYMVLAPNSDLFGISRKLTDKERDRLRRIVKRIKPAEHGIIVRTAAEGVSEEQITADIERLLARWARVEQAAAAAKALSAVYEEPPLVVKVIRDNFGPEFERAIVDDEDLYRQVRGYLDEVAPELLDKVELYGAPTADARARAAGAPALDLPEPEPDGSSPDLAPADAAEAADADADGDGADAPVAQTGGEEATGADQDAAPAEATSAEPAPAEPASAEATSAEPASAETAGDAEGSQDDAAAATPAEVDPLVGSVDLSAAAARREQLPPLFEAYDVGEQLRKAMGRKVWLPSGGYLIIESTEAMKVIDVNTGRFTGGKDTNLEEIVLRTNLEAADEIVRQLRLRDMGGIIIIDFIDMLLKANQDQVVRRLKRELLRDRTKTRVSEVSKLGLVQMTRKNVSQGLLESFSHSCEACEGRGVISELE